MCLLCKLIGHKFFYKTISEDGNWGIINHISFCHRCGLERNLINKKVKLSNKKCSDCDRAPINPAKLLKEIRPNDPES